MAKAIVLTCPQCSARLPAGQSGAVVRCGYCGSESRIVGRTARQEHPGASPAPHPPTNATSAWKWSLMVAPIIVTSLAISLYQQQRAQNLAAEATAAATPTTDPSAPTQTQRDTPEPPPPPTWSGRHLTLVDVDGDETPDALGAIQDPNGDTAIAAIDGDAGTVLWRADPLASDTSFDLFVTEAAAIVAMDDGHLDAFALTDGRSSGRVSVSEKVEKVCAIDKSTDVRIVLADERTMRFDLAEGTLNADEMTAPCTSEVPRGGEDPRTGTERMSSRDKVLPYGLIEGMSVTYELRLGDHAIVAVGHKQPGTAVPMIGVVELPPGIVEVERDLAVAEARERAAKGMAWHRAVRAKYRAQGRLGRALRDSTIAWTQVVPPGSPLEASTGDPRMWAAGDSRVFAGYTTPEGTLDIAAFAMDDGSRLWTHHVEHGSPHGVPDLAVHGDGLYVGYGGRLEALAADGTVRWSFGE